MRAGLETRHTFKVYITPPMTLFTQLMNISGLIVDDDKKKTSLSFNEILPPLKLSILAFLFYFLLFTYEMV